MKRNTKSSVIAMVLALAFLITGIPFTEAQAATKPVIRINGTAASGNSVTMKKGEKINLTAKSGKKNITKKCTWKSSRKNVATISKKGVLSAKKAGTTYITVKYKGKTSKKLKVVVLKSKKEPGDTSESGTEPDSPSVSGSHKITYNVNSKNKSDKLNGSSTQYVSGEILKFAATVKPASGHKFIGWFDAPTGGKRIYETYKPAKNMTLYAHYTDKKVQTVTFSLGCNYGGTYSFMSGAEKRAIIHYRDYDWLNQVDTSGPMTYGDEGNVTWTHKYVVNSEKTAFTVDDLPVPEVPGYTFVGWYTSPQDRRESFSYSSENVSENSSVDTRIDILYARFTKKITISFDDFRGGKYDDIVVDSYKRISECGEKLPVPEIPGATFLGWTMDADNHENSWSVGIINENSYFLNCIEWYGFMCSGCLNITKHMADAGLHDDPDCDVAFHSVNDDYHVFEETNHFTLYPVYKYHRVDLSFDPKGGYFPYDAVENRYLVFDDGIDDRFYSHESIALDANYRGSMPYGFFPYPGHESDLGADRGYWNYGNNKKTIPVVRRDNYIFDKWVYRDSDGNEQDFTYSTILAESMTVYAKWKPGNCFVSYDATDGEITESERNRIGLNIMNRYNVTTESTIRKDGKQIPVPVNKEGRKFLGWFTISGDQLTEDTQILCDTKYFAAWGTKTDSKNETQKPSKDKDTDSNNQNEVVQHVTDITVTDMDFQPVDKNNNKFTIEYGGKGNPAGLGFTATVLPKTLKGTDQNVIWTSSNPNIIAVTAGKEVIYSSNWFDYFEFGEETGEVVLTATSEANPSITFHINVTVIKK